MPRAMVKGEGVTYSDARDWFSWLGQRGPFTPSDLAGAMEIEYELACRFVRAGCWRAHGGRQESILEDTGDRVNGTWRGEEPLVQYRPIEQEAPRNHPHYLPEWDPDATPGVGSLAPRRGIPIGLQDERRRRVHMSIGGERNKVLAAEARRRQLEDSLEAKRQAAKLKAQKAKDIGNVKKYRADESLPR